MKKLRLFDSLKLVLATVACMFAIVPAHAAILPAGYTELEYIESTGTQWINTNVNEGTIDYMELKFETVNDSSGFMFVNAASQVGVKDSRYGTSEPGVYIIKQNVLDTKWYFTNETNGTTYTNGRIMSNYSLYLFNLNNNSGTTNYKNKNVKIYYYKASKNDSLVFDGIPARRDSDGVLGMYDLADANPSTAFHTNAGTGEFVAGPVAQIKIATTKYNEESFAPVKTDLSAAVNAVEYVVSNTMSQAQAIDTIATTKQTRPDEGCMAKYCLLVEDEDGTPHWYPIAGANGVAHNLPTGYTELQYIESTGTQYIDTGLKLAAQQTPFLIDIDMSFSDMSGRYLMGFSNSSPAYAGRYSNGTFEINTRYTTIKSGIDEKLNFQYGYFPESNNEIGIKVTKNGESEYLSSGRTSILAYNTNWYIFANNASGSSGTSVLKGKIYSAKAYKDNELVFNGIPAKNSSDVVGMYDMVSGTFFTNAGTGVFTGPEM